MIKINVIESTQPGVNLYIGKLKGRDLAKVAKNVKKCMHESGVNEGYQRDRFPDRCIDVARYIGESGLVAFPSSVVLSMRGDSGIKFLKENEKSYLEIPENANLWICDGQHRIGGIEKLEEIVNKGELQYNEKNLEKGMQIEIPVTFVDLRDKEIKDAIDIERAIFFIMNETQKRIPSALKDNLIQIVSMRQTLWHPMLEKQGSRITAVSIAKRLDSEDDSPLKRKIKMTAERGLTRPLNLNTLSRAIEKGFEGNNDFEKLDEEEKFIYIKRFWKALRDLFPAYINGNSNEVRKYLLLGKATVTYAVMKISSDIYSALKKGEETPSYDSIRKAIDSFRELDFTKGSPLAAFGGYEGVEIIYWNWLRKLLEARGILQVKERPKFIEERAQKIRKMADILEM